LKDNWTIAEQDYGIVLTPLQEWDLDRVNEFSNFLQQHLKPQKHQNFIVDLAKIEYIDSMALGVLVNLHRRYQEEGGTVYLLNPQETVDKILKESGISKVFNIFYNQSDMLAEIQKN